MAIAQLWQRLSLASGLAVGLILQHPAQLRAQATPPVEPLAQPAPPPAAPEPAPAPAAPPPAAPEPAPEPMVAEPAPAALPLEPTPPAPVADASDDPAAEAAAEDATKKPISVNAWGRVGLYLHGVEDAEKMDHLSNDGVLELHFDGQATEEIGLTGNVVAGYDFGAADVTDANGTVEILDVIGRFDLVDPFHVWVGRMLVPSDRANFSGNWFASPWNYAGSYVQKFIGGPPVGPRQGFHGRNDGMTIWGQAGGGLFKYYASAFDLNNTSVKPLWSGRLNLSLLNPEPGYYHSSTYYGAKDILAIGVAVQSQKDGSSANLDMDPVLEVDDDYLGFNADVLFEKDLSGSGVITIEGAFYKYTGDAELYDMSWLGLISYLTPEPVGPGKLQPLVRVQGSKITDNENVDEALAEESALAVDVQLGYVIADYSARLALGFEHSKLGDTSSNRIFLGAQILK